MNPKYVINIQHTQYTYELHYIERNIMTFVPNLFSGQPAHLHNLITAFTAALDSLSAYAIHKAKSKDSRSSWTKWMRELL